MRVEEKRFSMVLYTLLLFLIIAAGRVVTAVYNYISVDISYAEWVSSVLEYCSMLITGAKNALGYAAVAYCYRHISVRASDTAAVIFIVGLAAENAARFLIDYFTASLTVYGVKMALISLGLQFLYETLFLLLACVVVRLFSYLLRRSGNLRKERIYTAENGARLSLLLLMTAQLISELVYLLQFLSMYTDITNQEIASCVGSFIYILVMYGGVPLLLCEAAFLFLGKITACVRVKA